VVLSESKARHRYGKSASGQNENHHDGRSDYMPGPRTRMDNH